MVASLLFLMRYKLCLRLDIKQQLCYRQQLICRKHSAESVTSYDHQSDSDLLTNICYLATALNAIL